MDIIGIQNLAKPFLLRLRLDLPILFIGYDSVVISPLISSSTVELTSSVVAEAVLSSPTAASIQMSDIFACSVAEQAGFGASSVVLPNQSASSAEFLIKA